MIDGTLIVLGRETGEGDGTIETHADRLREWGVADAVLAKRYGETWTPTVDGDGRFDDGPVFVVPTCLVETTETRKAVSSVATEIGDSVCCCEPVGRSPAITDAIADRAVEHLDPDPDTSLVLVGLGSSSMPQSRLTLEYHERRLRDQTDYGEVTSAYLVQDPAVECARYNAVNDRIVAVPVFITPTAVTEEEIPAKLEVDRGGIEYADPIGTHPRVTDAIHSEVVKQHVLRTHVGDSASAAVDRLDADFDSPVATDGMESSR
ncbi:cobalamin (vitamin B12) biosynthesis CbiX protein [Halorubrum lipolyticum DSM 21995]|uniref:Cobalamin (Vitamin B12) biosynthesis CbiX protein n=2 Tax=Halorubrum lipolyticum TaxID=368624 RepID=M0NPP1_9EURY|nr:cobalamin (vitamin B12) biosynthesis CbiX protein [Halorubrum lipolyticum DSM 21995]